MSVRRGAALIALSTFSESVSGLSESNAIDPQFDTFWGSTKERCDCADWCLHLIESHLMMQRDDQVQLYRSNVTATSLPHLSTVFLCRLDGGLRQRHGMAVQGVEDDCDLGHCSLRLSAQMGKEETG